MNYATAEAEDNREKILKFIAKYIKQHCYSPAIYEIATDTGLSKATKHGHIPKARLLQTISAISLRQSRKTIRLNYISIQMAEL